MADRIFFISLALVALVLIAFAAVWPQGLGARSPGFLGHPPVQQTPQYQAAMKREADHAQAQLEAAKADAATQP
jgi:hypothetical protein